MSSTKRNRKYYGDSEPKIWPADHPIATKPRAKKDTKQWCRGKFGVVHAPVIVRRTGWQAIAGCRPAEPWILKVWPEQTWRCVHRECCARCGKVLRSSILKTECPDYPGAS